MIHEYITFKKLTKEHNEQHDYYIKFKRLLKIRKTQNITKAFNLIKWEIKKHCVTCFCHTSINTINKNNILSCLLRFNIHCKKSR